MFKFLRRLFKGVEPLEKRKITKLPEVDLDKCPPTPHVKPPKRCTDYDNEWFHHD